MNRRRSTQFVFLLFVCYSKIFSQFDYFFVRHLVDQNLAEEHKTYLLSAGKHLSEDSLNYFSAKYHLLYFNDTLFLQAYKKARIVFDADTNALNIASIAFLTARHKDDWFLHAPIVNQPVVEKNIGLLYRATQKPTENNPEQVAEDLRPEFLSYKKAFYKKPFLAAALSTAVPGLGQLYIGKKRSFLITLAMNLTCGIQAYEACYRLGVKNPYSIFSLGFFGLFYLSNIYGSYSDTKVTKKEKRHQLFINAAHYYNINYSGKLYQ